MQLGSVRDWVSGRMVRQQRTTGKVAAPIDRASARNFTITPLKWWNVFELAHLRNSIETEAAHLVPASGERKEKGWHIWIRTLLNRYLRTFVARENGRAVGYVSLVFSRFKKLRGNAYLTISVRATHQGKGIGTALIDHAEAYARSRGVRRMGLEVFGKNRAVALYRRLGYQEEGKKIRAIEDENGFDDMILMAKFLS